MEIIQERDIPTCSLIGITDVVVSDKPNGDAVYHLWNAHCMASFADGGTSARIIRKRTILIVAENSRSEDVQNRLRAAVEKRRREQLLT